MPNRLVVKWIARFAMLCACPTVMAGSAAAQVGIYGEYNGTHIPATGFTGTSTAWYQGFAGGAYLDVLNLKVVALGVDARGGYASAQGHAYRDILVGPRLSVKPPLLPIRPYIQAVAGVGGIQFNGIPAGSLVTSNKFQYGFIGGVDYSLIPHIDLRLAEVGYLRRTAVTSGTPAPALNLVSVGAGVVLHLP